MQRLFTTNIIFTDLHLYQCLWQTFLCVEKMKIVKKVNFCSVKHLNVLGFVHYIYSFQSFDTVDMVTGKASDP